MNSSVMALGMPGMPELIVIAAIALLIFGRRLPDVARSVGRSIVEFKKGLKDVKSEVTELPRIQPPPATHDNAPQADDTSQKNETATAPPDEAKQEPVPPQS